MDSTYAPTSLIGLVARPPELDSRIARRQRFHPGPQPRTPYLADLRIDGWLVQPSLNLLTRGDARVRVRAQLMDLLLCFARRPGKVFPKDELVAEVWEGRWVAESALSRCIAELRAAIGDDAQRPRVIETITKRGYRLIAAVEVVTEPDAPPSAPEAAAAIEAAHCDPRPDPLNAPTSFWQRLKLSVRMSA
jgi:DNA-binding winged helix-turn-helix (wHTH) protein